MGRFEGRRLSWVRLTVLAAVVTAAVFVGTSSWRQHQDSQAASNGTSWYAGYVDATVTPLYTFEQPETAAQRNVVLSFIVADPSKACTPTWGGAYSLDAAAEDLDLDRRIARLRQRDGNVAVSFGGAINSELATTCTDPTKLLAAYRAIVTRYDLRTIDLDIEGTALSDSAANTRRAIAMKTLQDERAAAGKDLRVWLTLPVAPSGLSTEGKQTVATMLENNVDLSGVNVMTMDYGDSREKDQSMLAATTAALNATHSQLSQVYARAGNDVGSATLWRRMGATPMIGQNDVPGEIFTLTAAQGLSTFAKTKGLGRLSMWSANRDRTCGENYPDLKIVSNSCSGIEQGDQTFGQILRTATDGSPDQALVAPIEPTASSGRPGESEALVDDPKTSPYPIWTEDGTYLEGTRVVWHRNAYVAKWWTQGDVPDDPVVDETSSPWRLIGPVLPGEKPTEPLKLPKGTYPVWNETTSYRKGERVMLDGIPFAAKWYSVGVSPDARATQDEPSPWRRLTDAELRKAAAAAVAK